MICAHVNIGKEHHQFQRTHRNHKNFHGQLGLLYTNSWTLQNVLRVYFCCICFMLDLILKHSFNGKKDGWRLKKWPWLINEMIGQVSAAHIKAACRYLFVWETNLLNTPQASQLKNQLLCNNNNNNKKERNKENNDIWELLMLKTVGNVRWGEKRVKEIGINGTCWIIRIIITSKR